MTGDGYNIYDDSNATAALFISQTCAPLVITNATWWPEPVIEHPKRNRVPFYRALFDQRAPRSVVQHSFTAVRPKWKPLMGRRPSPSRSGVDIPKSAAHLRLVNSKAAQMRRI